MSEAKSTSDIVSCGRYETPTRIEPEFRANVTTVSLHVGRIVSTARLVGQLNVRITTRPAPIRSSTE